MGWYGFIFVNQVFQLQNIEKLLQSIPQKFYKQIVIHRLHKLQQEFGLGGTHFSEKTTSEAERSGPAIQSQTD